MNPFVNGVHQIVLRAYLDQFSMISCFGKIPKEGLDEFIFFALQIPRLGNVCKSWNSIVRQWISKNFPCHYYAGSYLDKVDSNNNTFFKNLIKVRKYIKKLYKTVTGDKIVYKERLGSNSGENRNILHILFNNGDKWYERYIYTRVDIRCDEIGNQIINIVDTDTEDSNDKPRYYLAEFFVRDNEINSPFEFIGIDYIFHDENPKPTRFSGSLYSITKGPDGPEGSDSFPLPFDIQIQGEFVCGDNDSSFSCIICDKSFKITSYGIVAQAEELPHQKFNVTNDQLYNSIRWDVLETFNPNRYYW